MPWPTRRSSTSTGLQDGERQALVVTYFRCDWSWVVTTRQAEAVATASYNLAGARHTRPACLTWEWTHRWMHLIEEARSRLSQIQATSKASWFTCTEGYYRWNLAGVEISVGIGMLACFHASIWFVLRCCFPSAFDRRGSWTVAARLGVRRRRHGVGHMEAVDPYEDRFFLD
jgi:hypothetical protein